MLKRGFLACVTALLALPAVAGAFNPPEPSFWGLNYAYRTSLSPVELKRMKSARVETARMTINWSSVEAQQGSYNWAITDGIIDGLASRGIQPQPIVWGTPLWVNGRTFGGLPLDHQNIATPPLASPAAEQHWRDFLTAAVQRYGPGGTFWANEYAQAHPGAAPMPLTGWQIWNEPNIPGSFEPGPDPQKYAELLKISHDAIVAADPNAKIILAGIPGRVAYPGWYFLNQLYKQNPGIANYFDEVAVHPYADNLAQIRDVVKSFRVVMEYYGDGDTPLWVSEFGWGSAPPDGHLNWGPNGQAYLLYKSLRMFATHRASWHLSSVSWFNWRDPPDDPNANCTWCRYSGLFTPDNKPKPAWNVFQRFTLGLPLGHFHNSWLTHSP